ncbi:MAG: VCBS repeat-containing protein [Gemmataceae bacterium]|nr:VCBS repeat-containing protein [Gemmataceae bacterium]
MTRLRVMTAAAAVLLAAAASVGQPPPGSSIQLKQFGGANPEQFRQATVGRATDQVILELTELKTEVTGAKLPPGTKGPISQKADAAIAVATNLRQLAKQNRPRPELYAAYAELERAVNDLAATAHQQPAARPVVGDNLNRIAFAVQNLGGALARGDTTPGNANRWVLRLIDGLDDQTEALRDQLGDAPPPGYDRQGDQALRAFTRAVRQMGRTTRETGTLDRAKADYPTVLVPAWANVVAQFGRVQNVSVEVRGQLVRADGMLRRLGEALYAGNPGPLPPPLPGATSSVVAVGAGEGGGPRVRVFHDLRARPVADFFAYDPDFRGGVRVAVADLNGDGVADVVTAPGPGMQPLVRVFDGRDHSLMLEFVALDPNWRGGVNLAATDLTKTGQSLVAVGADVGGGPQVAVFDLAQGKEVDSFFAFPQQLRGGVRLAWGDVNGDGVPDLVTAPGPCEHPPEVKAFSGKDRKVLATFLGLDPRWRGGLWVAAADVNNTGFAHVAVGADAGGTPVVRVIDPKGKVDAEWLAYPEPYRGGVRVAFRDLDGDGRPEVVCVPGGGIPNVPLKVFNGRDRKPHAELPAFPGFEGGGFVGSR